MLLDALESKGRKKMFCNHFRFDLKIVFETIFKSRNGNAKVPRDLLKYKNGYRVCDEIIGLIQSFTNS